ncbi:glycosyltransferase family 4 protein [Candidatus Falkowbacteria bacterium]|nr:glycosyltransferase family 4 protein [Candidatus Falkowbacteria bacterium]
MKIGIDARMMGTAQATGVGSYIYNILTRILTTDRENEYVIFVSPKNQELLTHISHPHLTIVTTTIHWYTWQEQLILPFIYYRHTLDVLWVPQFNVPLLYRKTFIVTIHDLIQKKWRIGKTNPLKELIFNAVFDHAVLKSKALLTVSHHTKQALVDAYKNLNGHKVIVTHLGVDKLFESQPNFDIINSVLRNLTITKPYLLYTGVHRPHKNLETLVKAFAKIKAKHDVALVLGGPRDDRYTALTQTLASLDSKVLSDIILPGFVSPQTLVSLYCGALAYVVPSFDEGFGLNGLEAMQCKIPVLASNSTCLQEIYTDAAYYFDPHSADSLVEAFETITSDKTLQANLVARGTARVSEFNWDTTAQQTLHSLHSCQKDLLKTKNK